MLRSLGNELKQNRRHYTNPWYKHILNAMYSSGHPISKDIELEKEQKRGSKTIRVQRVSIQRAAEKARTLQLGKEATKGKI